MGWDQLRDGVHLPIDPAITIPELTEVELAVDHPPPIDDVEAVAHREVLTRLATDVTPGVTIAVGAGSRGLTARVELLRGTINGLRELGGDPFVVPAMGSHGGATADGQRAALAKLGITDEALGAEIRSTVATVVVAHTGAGRRIYLDDHAAAADRILPVNRVKPHTAFKGPIESGCTKMAVVGFGKQPGAADFHASTAVGMSAHLRDAIAALRETGRLLGGVASVESPDGDVVTVRAMRSAEVGEAVEQDLTEQSRTLVAPLPFDDIDVLIIERGGKDISGTTLDPNVTGRFWIADVADPATPNVRAIVLLGLTDVTAGNATGIGFADFVPAALAGAVDWEATYVNAFTAGGSGVRRARLPMVLPDEASCIRAAMATCGKAFDAPKRVVRIASTLHLTRCWVSDELLAELPPGARVVRR